CYVAAAATLAKGDFAATPAGWRALIDDGTQPLGVLDIYEPADGREARYGLRGAEAGGAFAAALEAAERFADPSTSYEARFLIVPRVQLTAVWVSSDLSLFLATR